MSSFWQKLTKPFLVLAPMEDVTDYAFRELIALHLPRPDVFFTEFTSSDGLCSPGYEKTVTKLKFSENHRPIIAQIWGNDVEKMYQSAKIVADLGFDGIDINMGCPDRAVMKKGAGAAHCNDQALAGEIIDAVAKGAKGLPVSVKTRLGFNKVVTDEWIPFLLSHKLSALTIHGRTAKQLSEGSVKWDEIAKAVEYKNEISPETVIIGNGDVLSVKEAKEKHEKFGVDGLMIGRGIFKNPWVFDRSKNPKEHSKVDYIQALQKHLAIYEETWGEKKNFAIMKKFFKMYINNFDGASSARAKLMESRNYKEANSLLEEILASQN